MVDTGATYTTLPQEVVEDLGCRPIGSRHVVLANGSEEEWPITDVWLTVDGHEGPTFSLIGLPGDPALLGAVTLEEFALDVDPVAKGLIPVRSDLAQSSLLFERGLLPAQSGSRGEAGRKAP